jgi:hypothetical protein
MKTMEVTGQLLAPVALTPGGKMIQNWFGRGYEGNGIYL